MQYPCRCCKCRNVFDSETVPHKPGLPMALHKNDHKMFQLSVATVDMTYTFINTVESVAIVYFGPNRYDTTSATNIAAQHLGPTTKISSFKHVEHKLFG